MTKSLMKQILKFGVVGGLSFVIDYGIFTILTQLFSVHYVLASTISFSVSVLFNYILSIKWVFDVHQKQTLKEFLFFLIQSLSGLGLNLLLMYFLVDLFIIHELISKIIATGIVMIYNFIVRKIFLEKKKEK